VLTPSHLLIVALLLIAAALAHWAFWRWKLGEPGREDERLTAVTADGWHLCLGRRRPVGVRRDPPLLLVHGIAMNRLALDFPVDRHSLARYLAEGGFDCFALDLRGHGASRPGPGAPRRWTLDDYLAQDIPAALDAIRTATGQPTVMWVGHSQGALLGLVAAIRHPARVAGVVALAPPVRLSAEALLVRLVPWLARLGIGRLAAQLVAPLVGWWHPRAATYSIQPSEMDRAVFRRMMMNVIEGLPPGVVAQFEVLARQDRLGSMDGLEDWRAALPSCRQPALFVSAPEDGLVPPAVVAEACALWGGEKMLRSAPPGVGHTDLLLGRRAPATVFPMVRDWLLQHSAPRAAP
jgi:pimeloyl-ACP methyl ester carboxylesterase